MRFFVECFMDVFVVGTNLMTEDYICMSFKPNTKIKLVSIEYTSFIFDHYEEVTNKDFEDTLNIRKKEEREIEIMAGDDMRRDGDFDRLRKIIKLIELDGEFSAEIEEYPELGLMTVKYPETVNYKKLYKKRI